ncbi:MAG: ferritin-like domain-containing protein [Candidatus Binatia bacterium]
MQPTPIVIGSEQHKELFCRSFIDTHDPYDPLRMDWPELDDASIARLRAMPFWDEAISTESDVARKVQALAPLQADPLLREAIALQGYEEGRHSALLKEMLRHYDIPEPAIRQDKLSNDPTWDFMRVGYGECFDSFFAFGLYTLARDSGLFPPSLLKVVAPIVQEEARHILFFVNWIAYCRAHQPAASKLLYSGRCALAMWLQVWTRIKTAVSAARGGGGGDDGGEDDFMLGVKDSLDVVSSPRQFLEVCLRENDARLAPYDPRLLRPRFVPAIARTLSRVLR